MALSTRSITEASSRRPRLTIALWVILVALAGLASSRWLGEALTSDIDFTNRPEAKRAAELVEERFGKQGITELILLSSEDATVGDPAFEGAARAVQAEAMKGAGVRGALTFFDSRDPSLVSSDRHTTLLPVVFNESGEISDKYPVVKDIVAAGNDSDGFEAEAFGSITLDHDFTATAEEDLRKGESFGIVIALIVLVAVFGAIVAGIVPIAMGVASIAVATGITAVAGQFMDFSFFVTNMISMMGLAVGIDYSLFIVSRYREERHRGLDKLDAIAASGSTASRAVFFSGMTVVFALAGMLILPTTIFRALSLGAIFVVFVAVLASLTFLPALLSLLGDRVNSLRVFRRKQSVDSDSHAFWDRITHGVMGRPVISLLIGAGLLLAAAFSYFDIDTGISGVSTLPQETDSRQAFETLSRDFPGGLDSPVEIVVDGDVTSAAVKTGIGELRSLMSSDDIFGPARSELTEARDTARITAPVLADPSSPAATSAIDRLRDRYVPQAFGGVDANVLVGGATAFNKDFFDLTDQYTPIVFAFVLGLSFLLLTIVFRSLVVPIKAIILNLLSVGAAYGLVVLVFQKGVGADLFGFQQVEVIEAWLPLFLFSILFGLSMDYHVFLLSRIREHFDLTHDNTESVAFGLRTTGGLITGAAIIMVAVFGGFAAGNLVMLQQMGFGLAVAVLIDATIVRSVLVPATMKLLGDRNWYLPGWLSWLPDMRFEGAVEVHSPPTQEPEPAHA
jgi:RND superfamily putative drug exporter